MNIMDS